MTDNRTDALEQALALHATPCRSQLVRERPLPDAVLLLIRIAAGDREALAAAAARTAESPQRIVEAAVLYIQQVLFDDRADSYRALGVRSDAVDDTIKEHYRWLMHWLHPDRNPERWEVTYSQRVNRAWSSLNSEQHRREYDASSARSIKSKEVALLPTIWRPLLQRSETPYPHSVLSPQTISKIPMFVLGCLGILAFMVVVLLYSTQSDLWTDEVIAADGLDPAVKDDGAQEAVLRRRIAFYEHVIELSQPIEPSGIPTAATSSSAQSAASAPTATEISADSGTEPTAAMMRVATLPDASSRAPPTLETARAKSPQMGFPTAPAPSVTLALPISSSTASNLRESERHATNLISAMELPDAATRPEISPVAPSISSDTVVAQEAASMLPRKFATAYAKGDLSEMMRLFAPDAVDNRGGIDAITEDYQLLFRETAERNVDLNGMKWIIQADHITGSGAFDVRLRRYDELFVKHVKGWIQIEARLINGRWKIQRIVHKNAEVMPIAPETRPAAFHEHA